MSLCQRSAKIAALVDVRDEDLLKEAAAIKQAERRLAEALSRVLEESSRINDVLKEVDLALISNENPLRMGKNIVGRDSAADVIMQAKMRDISRKHLLIESEGTDVVRVTDISSHGTWVHPRYLEGTGA